MSPELPDGSSKQACARSPPSTPWRRAEHALAQNGGVPKPRIADATGLGAITAWTVARAEGRPTPRSDAATAVRYTLQALEDRAPGASVEVRVPPFGAVQCVEGPGHTRGTPPNVIELDADTWLELATGRTTWQEASDANRVRASGTRADVSAWLPLVRR